jgi:hypothetical protein
MTDAIAARLRGADSAKAAKALLHFSLDFDSAEYAREAEGEGEPHKDDLGEVCNPSFALMSQSDAITDDAQHADFQQPPAPPATISSL